MGGMSHAIHRKAHGADQQQQQKKWINQLQAKIIVLEIVHEIPFPPPPLQSN